MKTYRQIIYRHSDTALMILPSDLLEQPDIRFIKDLSENEKQSFKDLETFLLTKIDYIEYWVYTTDINRLDAQQSETNSALILVDELDTNDRLIVNKSLDICKKLINI